MKLSSRKATSLSPEDKPKVSSSQLNTPVVKRKLPRRSDPTPLNCNKIVTGTPHSILKVNITYCSYKIVLINLFFIFRLKKQKNVRCLL